MGSNNGGVYTWQITPALNASADNTVNWSAGMAPSSVSPSGRAMMASIAKYRDDISGSIVTSSSGTSTSYIVSSNQDFDSAADMHLKTIAFTPNVTNTAGSPSVMLTVDAVEGPLRLAPNVDLPSGTIIQGTPYVTLYNNTDGAFYLQGGFINPYAIPLGASLTYWLPTTPNSTFAFPAGQAISRTTYATLFAAMGTTYGAGDGVTTFNLPNKSGRVTATLDPTAAILTSATMSPNGNTLGAKGGAQTVTLTAAQIPEITSNVQVNVSGGVSVNTSIGVGGGTVNAVNTTFLNGAGPAQNFAGSGSFSGSGSGAAQSNNTGGAAFDNMIPVILANEIMRII